MTGAGSAVMGEETLSAVSADDEYADRQFVEYKIGRAGISVTKRDSIEGDFLEAAKDASIIALDVRYDNFTYKSFHVAVQLKWNNPYRAIFFYTRVPEAIKEWPVNFAVIKNTDAAQHLGRVSLMILVHDISLAILKEMSKLPGVLDRSNESERLSRVFLALERFYALLAPTERSAERVDANLAQRYQHLRLSLAPFVENAGRWTSPGSLEWLPPVHRILFNGMCTEFSDLGAINGVHVKEELGAEVRSLELPAIGGYPPTKEDEGGGRAAETNKDTETFYLNVWFPDRPAEEPWLVMGRAERMLVNLGEQREDEQLGKSEPVSEEAEEALDTVEYVDVLILCSDADVVPLRSRIQVPPRKETTAQFEVTPLYEGDISLTVVLLVKNDPIHRTNFFFEVREAESDAGDETERVDTEEP